MLQIQNDDLITQKGNAVLVGDGGFQPGSCAIFWDLLFPLGDSTELSVSKMCPQMQLCKKEVKTDIRLHNSPG